MCTTPVPSSVLEFLAHKISTNIRELEGALNRVVAHGQLIGREITVEMAQDVLHDLLRQAGVPLGKGDYLAGPNA